MYNAEALQARLALVSAITLGQKSMLEQDRNRPSKAKMHIMAVSGLHAIILSLFIEILFFLRKTQDSERLMTLLYGCLL